MAAALDGTNGLTFNDGTQMGTANSLGMRNRIINGDMRIDQRNAGAAVSTNGAFPLDRWTLSKDGGTIAASRSTVFPAGFTNSLLFSVTTGYTPTAAQQNNVRQNTEGFNVSDFGWGAAGAQSVVLSFWVRSSLTGTFAGSVNNSAYNRSYVYTYSVSAANIWEYKTVIIAGDTSGTWLTDNSVGLRVIFDLGSGSDYNATAGVWSAGEKRNTAGAVQPITTSGATFYITGVQLEAGSVATPFERRPIGVELALCQRYFEKSFAQGITPANGPNTTSFLDRGYTSLIANNSNSIGTTVQFAVRKRTTPTVINYGNSAGLAGYMAATDSAYSFSVNVNISTYVTDNGMQAGQQVVNATFILVSSHWTASAEL
jgi:hypothetical protein